MEKIGAESFTVYMYTGLDGQQELQLDVQSAHTKNIYEACYTICKMIEEGQLQAEIGQSQGSD